MPFFRHMHKTTHAHLITSDPDMQAKLKSLADELGIALICHRDCKAYLEAGLQEGPVVVHETGTGTEAVIAPFLAESAAVGLWPATIGISPTPALPQVVEAMKAGALSFHDLPQSGAALQALLDEASADHVPIQRLRAESVRAQAGLARLSPREREVLDGLAKGGSNKEIARTLNISPRTVEVHRMTMMGKIGARSAADAIRLHLSAYIMKQKSVLAQ